MKKVIAVAILIIMIMMFGVSNVEAATSKTLANELYNIGAKYGLTSSDKIKIERYLADNPVTDGQANQVIAKANEAVKIMENAGTTDIKKLTKAQKNNLKTIANEAASIVGVTLTYKNGTVEIYKNGKLLEVITFREGKLAYTGNKSPVIVITSLIAVVALTTSIIVRKKIANV